MNSDYSKFNPDGSDQELLFMAIRTNDGIEEVVASIAICDFDDIEEYRQFKPWIAAFIVREDLRGTGVGSTVLELMEKRILAYGVKHIYLWTEGEKNFYGKRGYLLIDQLHKPGRVIDLMQKDLGKLLI
nr:GNAT family N-acetyltransferase [Candidatus Nanopelagicus hibericus]